MRDSISLPAQTAVLAAPLVDSRALEEALQAIAIRNKIVHEGSQTLNGDEKKLLSLFKVVGTLVQTGEYRFPTAYPGNQLLLKPKE